MVNGWTKKLIEESERATWRGAAAGSGEAETKAISRGKKKKRGTISHAFPVFPHGKNSTLLSETTLFFTVG